jgi:hypothetical protein
MSRKLTTREARRMARSRTTHGAGPGRPPIPTACPHCETTCASYRLAQVHCSAAGRGRRTTKA